MSDHPFKEMVYSSFPEFLAPSMLTYRASKMTTRKSPTFLNYSEFLLSFSFLRMLPPALQASLIL